MLGLISQIALLCTLLVRQPMPAPTPAAGASPSPVPIQTALPTPSPTPVPTASPIVLPPEAPPQIVDVHLSETTLKSGDTVSGYVVTSTNVASIEVRLATLGFGVTRTDFGHFEISYQVPHIPFFAHGNYTAQIIARNTAGLSVMREIPISLR